MKTGYLVDVGLTEYGDALNLQRRIAEARGERRLPDVLLLAEHPHVITVGHRGNMNNIHSSALPVYRVERGGDVTYHGPGQLIGYPVLSLEENQLTIHEYLFNVEEAIIKTLRMFNVEGSRREDHRGVWVGNRKIASVGVAIRKWVTFHGFALNVNTDLSYFKLISPCGLQSNVITSLHVLREDPISYGDVKRSVVTSFEDVFGLRLQPITSQEMEERHLHAEWRPPPLDAPTYQICPDSSKPQCSG